MSLLGLLAASQAGTPVDPGGGDPGTPDPVWPGWPTSADATLLSLRPQGRRVTTRTVGVSGATDTTISAALSAGSQAALTAGLGGKGFWDLGGPDYRSDILLGPGTYNEENGAGGWACLVGTTGNPADVVIQASGGGGGTIHSFGSMYMEALTLRAYSTDGDLSPKYPWHITGGPVTVANRCIFDTRGAVQGIPTGEGNRTAGLIGKDSSVLTAFYNCTFKATPGIANGFNMHGGPVGPWPETCLFINCTFEGVASVGSTGSLSATGQKSRMYFIGCTYDSALTTLTSDPNTEVYTDTSLPVSGSPSAVYRSVTTWPAVAKGVPPEVDAYYFPSTIGSEPVDFSPTVSDAATMTVTAGRTYYTQVKNTSAMHVTGGGITCVTAVGSWGFSLRGVDTQYVTNSGPNDEANVVNANNAMSPGKLHIPSQYNYSRYPGNNGLWHKVKFTGAAQVTGSALLPGSTQCFYSDNDGTTILPVASGTPHPLPFLRAAS